MQVSVEELSGLERRITVQVPAEKIDPEVQNRLKSLIPKVKLAGFRPGKVPFKVIKRMYGPQVRQEVLGEVLETSYQDALTQNNLRPAGRPKIEPKNLKEGEDLQYSATFEVLPEFEVVGTDGIKVERPVAEVTEADIDAMIETLRKKRADWIEVERPAQRDDRVTIDFTGKINGQDFPDNQHEDMPLILGSGAMPDAFEESLLGLTKGATTQCEVTFPEDYRIEEVAGNRVDFTIHIKAVAEPNLPEVDAAFAEAFDVKEDGVEGLRRVIRENMERELQTRIEADVKNQLLQGLLDANDVQVPQTMIDAEIEQMARRVGLTKNTENEEIANIKNKLFAEEARRRITLGFILSRLADTHAIKPDESRVKDQLKIISSGYEEPDAVISWYEGNLQAMDSVRALALEEQIIDWLLERAQVSDTARSFKEIMQPDRPQIDASQKEIPSD